MVSGDVIMGEQSIRRMIKRNMEKEFHPGTKPSIDFIHKILEDAYESGTKYDVTDMKNDVYAFAMQSTNQAEYCIKLVGEMHFKSEEPSEAVDPEYDKIAFYDIEIFPNLFIVCWKIQGEENPVIKMINPSPTEIEELLKYKLVGFNNRKYDNHMLYARLIGYSVEQLYELSQRLIDKEQQKNAYFREAYNLSYTDIYDFAAKKQSLKKWEIELGIHHQELGMPWDKPVPEERWGEVADYCINDVVATAAVFNHCQGDYTARQILADLAGGTVNDTTNALTAKIIFGDNRKPKLIYTDLATAEQWYDKYTPINSSVTAGKEHINSFPGYEFIRFGEDGHSHNIYCGEDVGFGGYVYAEPGMYGRTVCFDVSGMHPASIRALNCFGEYTEKFGNLVDARLAIKHKDFETARTMLDGKLAPYLNDESKAKDLSKALKIAVNSVYGLTSAKFDNAFKHDMNENNIVALRGALFMVNLKREVQNRGFKVIHCKTDSIKVVEPDEEISEFIINYGKKYSYNFEIEHIFEKICLVNDAVYIAKLAEDDPDDPGKWTATGTQFAVPYVFKTLFSKEPITFDDLCEVKSVKTAIYLDMNENLPDVTKEEAQLEKARKQFKDGKLQMSDEEFNDLCDKYEDMIALGHDYKFVGRVGNFCPIKPGEGGGELMRVNGEKYAAVTGSKGYRWLESESIRGVKEDIIDRSYYTALVDDAVEKISQYGDFEMFASDD